MKMCDIYFTYIYIYPNIFCGHWRAKSLNFYSGPVWRRFSRHFDHPVDRTARLCERTCSPKERSFQHESTRRGECDYRIRAVRLLHFVTQTRLERLRRIQKTHPSDRRVRNLVRESACVAMPVRVADSYATLRKRNAWDSTANELRETDIAVC